MLTKEITLHVRKDDVGSEERKVTLAYCFATEISYKTMAGEDITDFIVDVVKTSQKNNLPDIQKAIYLIIASVLSYYQSVGKESPISSEDLMYACQSDELGVALGVIIGLRAQFYHVPTGEPKETPKGGKKRKNA